MKREKEVPADLLAYLKERNERKARLSSMDIFCTYPVRAVKMQVLLSREMIKNGKEEDFRTVIIPAIDVYVSNKPKLKQGFLNRDALSFYVSRTRTPLPYGHVYAESGYVCLGTIFVPSAVPERAVSMPIETLFLHNDRNLSHGNSHLHITKEKSDMIWDVIALNRINPCSLGRQVDDKRDIIKHDEIWNLSADVAEQKSLPDALRIMSRIYDIIFPVGMRPDGTIVELTEQAEDTHEDEYNDEYDDEFDEEDFR